MLVEPRNPGANPYSTLQKKERQEKSPQTRRPPGQSPHMRPHFCTSNSSNRPRKKKKRKKKPTASARTLAPARAAFGPLSGKPARRNLGLHVGLDLLRHTSRRGCRLGLCLGLDLDSIFLSFVRSYFLSPIYSPPFPILLDTSSPSTPSCVSSGLQPPLWFTLWVRA
jgi:hypothetical protein